MVDIYGFRHPVPWQRDEDLQSPWIALVFAIVVKENSRPRGKIPPTAEKVAYFQQGLWVRLHYYALDD